MSEGEGEPLREDSREGVMIRQNRDHSAIESRAKHDLSASESHSERSRDRTRIRCAHAWCEVSPTM